MLTSPRFSKKPWFDTTHKQSVDIELVNFHEDQNFLYPLANGESTWQSNNYIMDEPFDRRPFRGSFSKRLNEDTKDKIGNEILLKDNRSQVNFKKNINAFEFSLEDDIREILMSTNDFSEVDKRKYASIINSKTRNLLPTDRTNSIHRYLEKKKRRKYVCQIKYKIRQDLACRRLRIKGKFVKSSKMDVITAANFLLNRLFIRRARKPHKDSREVRHNRPF